jgi:hypothetical protein
MKSQLPMWTFLLTLIACGTCLGGEGSESDGAPGRHFLQRARPVGGWNPYCGGVLHWWNPHCFPCQSGPDDYCRKPLPRVCWPAYPPYYIAAPPETGYPPNPRPSRPG